MKSKTLHFEKNMEALEDIVQKLETGALPLDVSLKYYEKGIHLARKCQEMLASAKQTVEIIQHSETRDDE